MHSGMGVLLVGDGAGVGLAVVMVGEGVGVGVGPGVGEEDVGVGVGRAKGVVGAQAPRSRDRSTQVAATAARNGDLLRMAYRLPIAVLP